MQIWDYLLKKGRSWEKNDKGMATACQERKNLSRVSSQGTPHSSGRGSPFTVCTQSLEFSILNICHLLVKEMGWSKSLRTQLLKQLKGHKTRKRVIWSRQIWGHLGEAWVRCLKDVRPGSVPKRVSFPWFKSARNLENLSTRSICSDTRPHTCRVWS